MSDKKEELRAPATNTGKFRSTEGNSVSFETFFLRSLYDQGKIDEKLILDILSAEKISCEPGDVFKIIKDSTGSSMPRGLAQAVRDLANIITEQN